MHAKVNTARIPNATSICVDCKRIGMLTKMGERMQVYRSLRSFTSSAGE